MKPIYSQWTVLLLAVVILIATLLFVGQKLSVGANGPGPGPGQGSGSAPGPVPAKVKTGDSEADPAMPPAQPISRSDVSVITLKPASYRARIEAFGEAKPRFELQLGAQVAGRVSSLSSNFEAGQRVAADSILASLENSSYRAAVSSAEYQLAAARQELLEAEREADQARAEWDAAGLEGVPDSALVLHEPQLATARAAVENQLASLTSAGDDLRQTRIRAPFDALVVARQIVPGSYLQVGSEVATLYSTDRVELSIELTARDWQNLPDSAELSDWPVQLSSAEGSAQWNGRVLRATRHLDAETRQRALIVAVDRPFDQSPALLPGSYVKAMIEGRKVSGLWKLPGSALSQRGEIWYVDEDQNLAKFKTTPLFSDSGAIYVSVPEPLADSAWQVLVHPLNSYLTGMTVNPIEEPDHE